MASTTAPRVSTFKGAFIGHENDKGAFIGHEHEISTHTTTGLLNNSTVYVSKYIHVRRTVRVDNMT